jgi:ABC-2 type transport system ATP-binding protein
VATVSELRRLHRAEVSVTYTGTVPELADVPGVEGLQNPADGQLRFTLIGPPGAALRTLAAADVTAVTIREPSLEEMFLDYYGEASR